jgi:hypothetical protein
MYLRRLLVVGITSIVRRAKYKPETADRWLAALLSRKPARVVTVALANKAARVIRRSWPAAGFTACPNPLPQNNQANAERIQRLRGRCDVMANRSDWG